MELVHARTQPESPASISEILHLPSDIFLPQNVGDDFLTAALPSRLQMPILESSKSIEFDPKQARQDYPVSRKLVSLWNAGALGTLAYGLVKGGMAGVAHVAGALAAPHLLAVGIVVGSYFLEGKIRNWFKSREADKALNTTSAAA